MKKVTRRDFLKGMAVGAAGVAAAGVLGACSSSTTSSTTTTDDGSDPSISITLAHGLAEAHAVHIAMTNWATKVEEASNGTISITIKANGTLGSESDCIASIQAGALEMAKVSASTIGNFNDTWDCVSVPYVFNDEDHYYDVMNGDIAQDLYALTEDDGFIGLTWFDSGSRSFYTSAKAIREPSDLNGLTIRTMDSTMAIKMMEAMGGASMVMGYSEVYTAMQNGNIDGAENNVTAMNDHADVTKYYCYDEHTRIPDILIISTETWNSMSDNQRAIMSEQAEIANESFKQEWADFVQVYVTYAEEQGVEFITDVDTPAFQEAVQSIYDELTGDVKTMVERIQAAG